MCFTNCIVSFQPEHLKFTNFRNVFGVYLNSRGGRVLDPSNQFNAINRPQVLTPRFILFLLLLSTSSPLLSLFDYYDFYFHFYCRYMIKTTKIRKTFKTKEKIYLHKPLFVKCIKHFKGLVADLLEFAFTVHMSLSDIYIYIYIYIYIICVYIYVYIYRLVNQ